MTHLSKLIDHCIWANGTWIDFIAQGCPTDEYLRRRMSHILLGEQVWFQRVMGQDPDRDVLHLMDILQMREKHTRHASLYARLLAEDLTRIVHYRRFTGEEYQSPVADILLHLVLHGTHHRGQMAADASAKGFKPMNTDFVQFCLLHER